MEPPVIPDLAGQTIDILRLDGSVQFWTSENWSTVLATLSVALPGQDPVEVDPGDPVDHDAGETYPDLPDVLKPFLGKTIHKASVNPRWDLHIEFTDGSRFDVPAGWSYEAWELHGPGGELFICRPGGGGLLEFDAWAQ